MRRVVWAASCALALVLGWIAGRSQEPVRPPVPRNRPAEVAGSVFPPAISKASAQEPSPLSHKHRVTAQGDPEGRSVDLLSGDPNRVATLLAEFQRESSSEHLVALAEVLIEIHDPSILPTMLSLAADPSRSREQRMAALMVIDARNEREAFGPVSEMVRTERDPELLRAAIHAFPDGQAFGMSEVRSAAAALRTVLILPTESHQGAKEAALILLGFWSASDRPSVLAALRNDPSPKIRAAAAFGLIYTAHRDGDTLRALADVVANGQEEPSVRANAWRALGASGVLPDEVIAAYQSFRP